MPAAARFLFTLGLVLSLLPAAQRLATGLDLGRTVAVLAALEGSRRAAAAAEVERQAILAIAADRKVVVEAVVAGRLPLVEAAARFRALDAATYEVFPD